ncbi:hypothetical protein SELR_22520 [Selenomonas ruminantium subsp. lactilytica TAM6421]|uniref:Uncharacterized protein n=1 Tax=Selenomonas ruminantium subsp. lactilytica (strain NBRC 103574 / TAM6421) TaxID=927704 RepID=I0GT73_SELRL|nr:hypothetical protein [Selenomonas ruminantium]BAL83960.1 hypothetical protein SELR_22520 [Selenomonas ruminantium subsp. lactilytica TAM6421]
MSEPIQTGHKVYLGNNKMNMEMLTVKPYYVATPGSNLTQEEMEAEAMEAMNSKMPKQAPPPAEEPAREAGSPEDIAARIAGDRTKNQADILELAKNQVGD